MKIFTRCVYAWRPDGTPRLESCEGFEYEGALALCGKSPSPPPAPDYTGAAQATSAGNLEMARQATQANRVNQFTPYGSSTWTNAQSAGPYDPAASFAKHIGDINTEGTWGDDAAKSAEGWRRAAAERDAGGGGAPVDNWSQNVTLNPQGQELFNQYQQQQKGMSDISNQLMPTVQGQIGKGIDMGGAPDTQYGASGGQMQNQLDLSGVQGIPQPGSLQSSLDLSGVQDIPQISEAARKEAEDAAYRRMTSRLDPQWEQREAQERVRLANQGISAGGEAYDKNMGNFGRERTDAYGQALSNALREGLAAQQSQFGMGLAANQAGFGQALAGGQFGNQAMQNQFGMGLAANQGGLQNALAQGQFANQAQAQGFGQSAQNVALSNAARQQEMQQQAYQQNMPLNQLSALMSGSQVQQPQFSPVPQQQTTTGPNYLGAAQGEYGGELNKYNAGVGSANSMNSGLMSMAAMAAMYF